MRIFHLLCLLGSFFSLLAIALFFQRTSLAAQSPYLGPTHPLPGNPHLVRVQLLVRDSPEQGGVVIQSISLGGQEIALKPRDIYGNRGTASLQMAPGKYVLRWVVKRDRLVWPRTTTHEEEVSINARDLWIQISIVGEEATIS